MAIVEVALIVGSMFVDGPARWVVMTCAGLAFFVIVGWFFALLTFRNWVLYPPRDYPVPTDPSAFVDAMVRRPPRPRKSQE